ncbi:MAG: DUF364 domain-containing protein [Gammaproteobacteria bacterium]|nr:DUF364 domain-containing protein [Gammaproteobacteria bacterium]
MAIRTVPENIRGELIELMCTVVARVTPPLITRVYLPDPQPSPDKNAEFGVIGLADGSAGFFYAWLGETQRGLSARYQERELVGANPADLITLYASDNDIDRSFGLAAINAISQHLFNVSGFAPSIASDSMASLALAPEDHIGVVGYFPSFIQRLRERGFRLTVIERKPKFVCREPGFEVTLDPNKLRFCNKVLATGAILLNDTFDSVLEYCRRADAVAVVGPTASCIPDPLFARGVHIVGGTQCVDLNGLIERARAGRSFGETARKYTIAAGGYPGVHPLLDDQ